MVKVIAAGLLFFSLAFSQGIALARQAADIEANPRCKYCNMDRGQYAHSRMAVEYDDGTATATCSIHCLAVDLAQHLDKSPKSIQAGDFGSKEFIDAEKAYWVVGGEKPGVMTKRAKWAFEKKEDAEAFVKNNGGEIVAFDDAMKASYEDMYADTKMIREKRARMRINASAEKHQH